MPYCNFINLKGSSLAIDAYANDPSKTLIISSGLPDKITLLPINFVASDGSTGEWQYTAAESPLEVSTGKGFFKKTVKFELLPAPPINVVAGAASSFAGAIGSPTILSKFVDNFLKNELQFLGSIELKDLNECLPLVSVNEMVIDYSARTPNVHVFVSYYIVVSDRRQI